MFQFLDFLLGRMQRLAQFRVFDQGNGVMNESGRFVRGVTSSSQSDAILLRGRSSCRSDMKICSQTNVDRRSIDVFVLLFAFSKREPSPEMPSAMPSRPLAMYDSTAAQPNECRHQRNEMPLLRGSFLPFETSRGSPSCQLMPCNMSTNRPESAINDVYCFH